MNSSKMTKKRKKSGNYFLAMWCCDGLECIYDLTKLQRESENWEKSRIWNILKEEATGSAPTIPLQMMILRARTNAQRYYEIYTFNTDKSIDKETVEELFNTSPQFIVDFIRQNGFKIYSDRELKTTPVIA